MSKNAIWAIVGIIVLGVLGYWVWAAQSDNDGRVGFVTNFDECVEAGYPVGESLPRRCETPEGQVYFDEDSDQEGPTIAEGCYVGGCSSEICSDQPDVVTACEHKPEAACYKEANCGRLDDGSCGWIQTEDLKQCLITAQSEPSK